MRNALLFAIAATVAATSLGAQTVTYFAPGGTKTVEGNSNNTIPWWSTSATYQQIHDASDLGASFPGGAAAIKGLSFRKDGDIAPTTPSRTMDVQITLGTTSVSSAAATPSFATNLGGSPIVVLPYTNVSLPALSSVSVPNPQGWVFPFATPYAYASTAGNLCVEIRFMNSSLNSSAGMDSLSALASTFPPLLNSGCFATGEANASMLVRAMTLSTGTWTNTLFGGGHSAAAVMVIGVQAQSIDLGFCSTIETIPIASVNGTTFGSGTWINPLVAGPLIGQPSVTLYSQFAWLDAGLPGGIGLSPCGATITPPPNYASIARIYAAPRWGGAGNETALTGTVDVNSSLVLGLDV